MEEFNGTGRLADIAPSRLSENSCTPVLDGRSVVFSLHSQSSALPACILLSLSAHQVHKVSNVATGKQKHRNTIVDAEKMSAEASCRILVVSPTAARAHQFVERMHLSRIAFSLSRAQ